MPQLMLPMVPPGTTIISKLASVVRDENRWVYFIGMYPIYSHTAGDRRMFKIVTSQLIESGACRHSDIIKTFGVSKSSVNRALKKYRQGGIEAFFRKRTGGRRGTVLTPQKLEHAQELFDAGLSRTAVLEKLEIPNDTLRKAINDGRLNEGFETPRGVVVEGTDKSSRNCTDTAAANGIGTACTRTMDRVATSLGAINGADTHFDACLDVSNGGVLCALPALVANGLLDGVDLFLGKIRGFYTVVQILILLAFMGLCRIKTVEKLRGYPPGELGKLVGIDRIPEIRCLREKIDDISAGDKAEKWAAHLSKRWMKTDPDTAGTLYIDGHVRVYNGKLTRLPRRFVSRQRLCLRATTDYWLNDAVGLPYFVVEKPVDPGLLKTLEENIVPRLLEDVPNQPTDEQLGNNKYLCRFVIVFDREGYSPAFFRKMWKKHRIACVTYHKYPAAAWSEEWFKKEKVGMPGGECVEMRLAEMGSRVGSGKTAIWMREIRKLTKSGHQTSLISTGYDLCQLKLAASMFTRWCQENFFRYMRKHFEFDMLQEYGTENLPDTERVVNPVWREMNRQRNGLQNKLRYRRGRFAELTIHPEEENDAEKYEKWLAKKSELYEEIEQYEQQLETIKIKIKNIPNHVSIGDLAEKDRFFRLSSGRKRLMDTIRMIAYRAETAMVPLLTGKTVDSAEARHLLQDLFIAHADILPDIDGKTLRVRIHNASRPVDNRRIEKLLEKLNKSKTKYPNTNLSIVYELVK